MEFRPFTAFKGQTTSNLEILDNGNILDKMPELQVCVNVELVWRSEGRPYYNVYPIILDSILKTDLSSFKVENITFPHSLQTLCFRFDKSSGRNPFVVAIAKNGLSIAEHTTGTKLKLLSLSHTANIASQLPSSQEIVKILFGCLMLDEEFIERDMNEKEKRNNKPLQYFKKIDKFGWNVGAVIEKEAKEKGAHYRRPHLSIRWIGKKGSLIPKLTRIKGAMVNKKKLFEIPTGYESNEEVQKET